MKEQVSIKQIAEICGVSVATVSRVINDNGRFSEETRQKVLSAIKQTGYKPNKLAIGLRKNKSNIIGILVPDITNGFYSSVVKKCEQALSKNGYSSIVCNTDRSAEKEANYLQTLSEHMVDGIIIISTNPSDHYLNVNIPIVFIDRNPDIESKIVITSDHYYGALEATNYLIKTGFSPYIITTKTKAITTKERVRGFYDAIKQHKIDSTDRMLTLHSTSNEFLDKNTEALTFIKNISDKKIGIFAINDNVAYITLQTALKLGKKIPDDFSIIGFDDAPISKIATPQISSIHQNTDELAEKATQLLMEKLADPDNPMNVTKTIPTNLILRNTTLPS